MASVICSATKDPTKDNRMMKAMVVKNARKGDAHELPDVTLKTIMPSLVCSLPSCERRLDLKRCARCRDIL